MREIAGLSLENFSFSKKVPVGETVDSRDQVMERSGEQIFATVNIHTCSSRKSAIFEFFLMN